MIETLSYIIMGFFVLDIYYTYSNINIYRKVYPDKDYTTLELNPMPRFFWRHFGLLTGGIISTIIQAGILFILLNYVFNHDLLLVFTGIYVMVLLIHLDNNTTLNKKLNPKPNKQSWRKYAVILILLLGFIDMATTYYFVDTYSNWQPDRPFEDMEVNPILLYLWNNLGFEFGMAIGFIILMSLNYIVARYAWIGVVLLFVVVLTFTLYNNITNINTLHELIKLYPTGYR